MGSWLKRFQERQRELARGADADLVQNNRTRYKHGLFLLAFGLLVGFLRPKVHLSGVLQAAAVVVSIASFTIGFVLLRWAYQESIFLNRPDPEKPPSILENDDQS
jgi:hypothetical protein